MAQLLAPLKLRQHLLFLDELVPDADRASAYTRFCNELWTRLQQQGVAVLELGSDEEFSAFASALETCAVFFAADEPVKQGAQSSVLGEGYAIRPGKELLAVRPGAPAWGSGRSRTQHAALQKASSRADRLCRGLLCALCRSPGLDVHSGRVLGLLDDAPLLGQASASLLRCARYSPDPHAAQLLAFAPHHDRGVLTLVASAQEQGLQVQLPQQGQGAGAAAGAWVDVPLGPGRVAVLCGYSLSYALGGLLQPALHRVRPVAVAGGGGAAGGSAATAGGGRVSLAYELCFRPNACVDPAAITQGAAEQLPAAAAAAAAAAGEGGTASRPALLTSALMERFEATHPVSINGGVRVKQEQPRAQQEPAARRQREEANLVSDGGEGEQKPAAAAAAAGRSGAQAQRAAGQGWAAVANAAAEGLQSASQAPPSDATKQQQQRRTSLRLQQQQQNSRQDAPAPALTGTATKQPVGTSGGGSSKEREQQAPAGATARRDAGAAAANGGAAGVSAAARRQREENRTAAGVEAPEAKRGRHGRVPAVDQHAGSPAAAPTALSQPAPAGGSGHGGQAEAPAEGQHGDDRINIIIKDQSGSEVRFKVKQTTQLQQVFDAYCNLKGLDILKLRFIYNGNRVLYGTVGERGVQDGGIIDSVLEQVGS